VEPTPTATTTATTTATPTATPAPDLTRPRFVRLAGTATVRAGYGRWVGAAVADNRALRRLRLWVDGRLLRTWTLSGTYTSRKYYVPAWRLRYGNHTVRWGVTDAAGNSRYIYVRLYVR
jgi:hypothetical protein